jgi:serine/threonine-protein kinase
MERRAKTLPMMAGDPIIKDTIKDLHVHQVKRCPECGVGFGVDAAFCPFDGVALKTSTWDPARDPLTDTVVDNRYEVLEPLGEGGMGAVYKVRHTTLDRMFAMKVLRRDLAADTGLAARFHQEARATASIHHPAVVAISDFGELDDGAPYFVMELLVGETLATRMRARGLLTPREAGGIARKLADALGAAHAANVIHRDLKPENVFLVGEAAGKGATDEIRVVDFGAAKVIGGSKLTRPGVVFGTPYYMSPEQASGGTVDARADVYSLGVLLYEMVTGSLPFEADTYMGVLTKHMFVAPARPSERAPSGVQLGELENVVLRALEKDPEARFKTMAELASAIDLALDSRASARPKPSRSSRPLAFPTMSTADRIQASVSRRVEEEAKRTRRTIVIAAAAAATLIMLALAVVLVRDVPKNGTNAVVTPSATPPASAPAPSVTTPETTTSPVPATSAAVIGATAPSTIASTVASAAAPVSASPPPPPPPPTTRQVPPAPRPNPAPAPPPPRPSAPPTPPPRGPDDIPDPWKSH